MKSNSIDTALREIKTISDVYAFTDKIFSITSPSGDGGEIDVWGDCEKALLNAMVFYLWYMRKGEMTSEGIKNLLGMASVDENSTDAVSPLDKLFIEIERRYGVNNLAVQEFYSIKTVAKRTFASIAQSLAARLNNIS